LNPWIACFAPQYALCSGMPPVGQRRPDLDDGAAVALEHVFQRGLRAVHEAQVAHLGDPAEFTWVNVGELGEHVGEGVVDPHVDGAQLLLGPGRRALYLLIIRCVGLDGQGLAAEPLDLLSGARQSGPAPRQ
jgi:hypothetical protein